MLKQLSLLLLAACFILCCKNKAAQLTEAEELAKTDTAKAIKIVKAIFNSSQKTSDWKNAATAGLLLGNIYRNASNNRMGVYYDSASVGFARKTKDSLLLQRAILDYAMNLNDMAKVKEVETVLTRDSVLFARLRNAKTTHWYQIRGEAIFKQMNMDGALQNYRAAMPLAVELKDTEQVVVLRYNIANTYLYKGNYDSIKMAYDALEYFEKKKAYRRAGFIANAIGFAFQTSFNLKEAQKYFHKAYELGRLARDSAFMAQTEINGADVLLAENKLDSAEGILLKNYKYVERIQDKISMIQCQLRLAALYTEINRPQLAMLFFNKADTINQELRLTAMEYSINQLKGVFYAKYKNYSIADSFYTASEQLAARYIDKDLMAMAARKMQEGKLYSDKEVKRFDSANHATPSTLVHADNHRNISDSELEKLSKLNMYTGSSKDSNNTILVRATSGLLKLEQQYKTRIISDSLQLQKQQVLLTQSESKQKDIIIAATTVLLLLVATGFYLQYRSRQRAERDKARIELLQNEIHHRVKNNLAVINRLVEVAGKNSVEDTPLAALKNRIKSIELLHNHLYSEKARAGNIALQPYFEDLSLAIAATFHSAKNIAIQVDAPAEVDSIIAEKLGLIVNELVTNSYKYAFENKDAGKVSITARQQNGMLNLQVADDGIGLPETKTHNSYGMKLIKGLSHEVKGQFSFHNSNGTRFELAIPLTA